jgi:hypothetical protein
MPWAHPHGGVCCSAWQANVLPLHHRRRRILRDVFVSSKIELSNHLGCSCSGSRSLRSRPTPTLQTLDTAEKA